MERRLGGTFLPSHDTKKMIKKLCINNIVKSREFEFILEIS